MEVIMIDTETTGLFGYPDDVVVEIALSRVDLDKGTVKPAYTSIVGHDTNDWPQSMKHAWIFENTELTVKDVRNGTPIDKVVDVVREFVSGQMVTSYNVAFDFDKFLNRRPWRLNEFCTIVTDPMLVAKDIMKIESTMHSDYRFPRLQTVYDRLCPDDPAEIHGKQDHRALSDTMVAGHVMLQMYKGGFYRPEPYQCGGTVTDLDKIIRTISERPLTADEIASYTGYSKSAVSDALLFMARRKAECPYLRTASGDKAMKWFYRKEASE